MVYQGWRDIFPYEEANQVVRAIKETWDLLAQKNYDDFQPGTDEPKLTIRLKILLGAVGINYGLTGFFVAEGVEANMDLKTGKLEKVGKTDILYVSRRVQEEFTFEFKKLSTKSESRRLYRKYGIMRFVTGKYSSKKHLDFMVGIIVNESEADEILKNLKKSFAKPNIKSAIHLLTDNHGEFIFEPSKELPDSVNFDTKHARTLIPNSPDITICHFHVSHIRLKK